MAWYFESKRHSLASKGVKTAQRIPKIKDNHTLFRKIAINSVKKIGEFNTKTNTCEGNCIFISREIVKNLEKQGFRFPEDVHLIEPTLSVKGGVAFGNHQAVILPKHKLIIDTQLWQIDDKRTPLKSRKVIFNLEEYKKKGLRW